MVRVRVVGSALVVVVAWGMAGCTQGGGGSSSSSTGGSPDAGAPDPYHALVTPDPTLDATTPIRRGPYLQAPSEGTITVSWHTDAPSTSRVEIGPEGGAMAEVVGSVFQQLPTTADELTAGTPPVGYQHEVVLTGLAPNARYAYRVLSAATPFSAVFTAPPAAGDAFTFLLMGDTRTRAAEHAQVAQAMSALVDSPGPEGPPRFVANTGDLVAAGGSEENWDGFFAAETPVLSRVPLLPVFGNHEVLLGRTIFEGLFRAPPTSTSPSERWYSATIGDVHLATVDPYALMLEPHLEWLERDLSTTSATFKLVLMHPPMFTRSSHEPDMNLRALLMPVLRATGAQLVVTGHNHVYERWMVDGLHQVVTGGGGAPLYGIDDSPTADNTGATRAAAQSTLHFLLAAVNGRRLTVQAIAVPGGAIVDCFVVDADQPGVDVACQ